MKYISWILMAFGVLLLISIFAAGDRSRDDFFYMIAIAFSFVLLGSLGKEYVRREYRGGVATIVGAMLAVFGLQFVVFAVEQFFHGADGELVGGGAFAAFTFCAAGIALLGYGHTIHQRRNSQRAK